MFLSKKFLIILFLLTILVESVVNDEGFARFAHSSAIINNKLYIHPGSAGADIELKRESETKYFYANGTDQQIEFEAGDGSRPAKVWHIAWGVKREMNKME